MLLVILITILTGFAAASKAVTMKGRWTQAGCAPGVGKASCTLGFFWGVAVVRCDLPAGSKSRTSNHILLVSLC